MTVSRSDQGASFSRYLPIEPLSREWELHIIDCGYTEIPPGTAYPPGRHPEAYMFTWERGRELNEYQLVYITRGAGSFESREAGRVEVQVGDVFLLHPGVWHRYRPNPETGWDENWVGFDGAYARRIMPHFFPATRPLLRAGLDSELLHLVQSVARLMQDAPPGYSQAMAGYAIAALARARALAMRERGAPDYHERRMHEARRELITKAAVNIDLEALAQRLGYSYSRFRTVFKEHTGLSPRQYQIEIRINRARDLLTRSDRTISEIADLLGFDSVYYFSRLFKKKTGAAPSAFRGRKGSRRTHVPRR